MSSPDESTSLRAAGAVGTVVAMLPVPALAPAVGGGLAAALATGSRRRNAGLGAAVGFLGGLGYLTGWAVLALVLSGTFPPALPNGGAFEGFAGFVLVLDIVGGTVGGMFGGGLARRARARGDESDQTGYEQPE
ncbi:hypothetical protein [Haloglomus halophilum]|uniref:hypothetical protein n=1 Tax=Haloglomus halophilum TaxID=2962672 RepID=UPI0020C98252|nr:hypothetical protein [Haloglomus halophilum]